MKDLHIQLIQPPRNEGYVECSKSACYPQLGTVSIATYCRKIFPQAEIEVLDGELLTLEEIISRLQQSAFVGIETKLHNYTSALQIARAAKERGCVVILGGVYASALADLIIRNQSDIVDYVVNGYGEIPLTRIIHGEIGKISKQPRIIFNPQPNFNEIPSPDRSEFLDLRTYMENFEQNHPTWSHYTATNIFTLQGCEHKCLFCDRQTPGVGQVWYRDPQLIWQEVRGLVEEFGVDLVLSFDDQMVQDLEWLAKLVSTRPADIGSVGWYVFLNADSITRDSIELLKRLPLVHAFVGIETGDPALAKTIGKGNAFSPERTLAAVRLLAKNHIQLTPSFVAGLPGETEATLKTTLEFARRIQDMTGFEEIFAACLVPYPGSRAFTRLVQHCPQLRNQDQLDAEELTKLWFEHFCQVDYETARGYVARILRLGQYHITVDKEGYQTGG